MDWNLAIEKNLEALRRVTAMLVAMVAGAGVGGQFTFFPQKGGDASSGAPAEKSKLSPAPTLPRHLHRYVLRLLRPAEAATRRLIILSARGLVVKIRPWRPRKPKPQPEIMYVLDRVNGSIVSVPMVMPEPPRPPTPPRKPSHSLPLLDPLPRFGFRRRYVRPTAQPHIWSFDGPGSFSQARQPDPPPPSPDDPLDAARLSRRLEAIVRALNDLPGQAERFARWTARRDARWARERGGVAEPAPAIPEDSGLTPEVLALCRGKRRTGVSDIATKSTRPRHSNRSPMRPGRPPGWRRRPSHDIHQILNEVHGLAVWARDGP